MAASLSLLTIPLDLRYKVFTFLDPAEFARGSRVCKNFSGLFQAVGFSEIYQSLSERVTHLRVERKEKKICVLAQQIFTFAPQLRERSKIELVLRLMSMVNPITLVREKWELLLRLRRTDDNILLWSSLPARPDFTVENYVQIVKELYAYSQVQLLCCLPGGHHFFNQDIREGKLLSMESLLRTFIEQNPDRARIQRLVCVRQNLVFIPREIKLLVDLRNLNLDGNRILTLKKVELPPSLEGLSLRGNPLRNLCALPHTLTFLSIRDTNVESFTNLPANLKIFECNGTSSGSFPSGLTILSIFCERADELRPIRIPTNLLELKISVRVDQQTKVQKLQSSLIHWLRSQVEFPIGKGASYRITTEPEMLYFDINFVSQQIERVR